MIATPWGDSERLRREMLPPGRGNAPQAVAENQRRRLYGAMVASVAERGFENTRVADLVELSGVSLRSFYDLFADKEACLAGAIESLVSSSLDPLLAAPGEKKWETESRELLQGFASWVVAQPAAARMCLVEAHVAGGEAAAAIELALMRGEGLIRQRLAASPEWSGLPAEMATVVAAVPLELIAIQLITGHPQLILDMAEDLADLLQSIKPPTRPLRSAARAPEIRPEELEASDHAERALRAFEALLTQQPYGEVTMEQVAKRAKMSVRTLYANFSDREDLLLSAIDSAGAQVVAGALPAYRRASTPPEGMRSVFGAFFALLAARPNLAHLLLVATYEGGAPALLRRGEALRPLETLFTRSAPHPVPVGRSLFPKAMLRGVISLARRRLIETGSAGLPSLATTCTYLVLAPLLGAEAATAAAEGKTYRRPPTELVEAWRKATSRPQTDRVLTALAHGPLDLPSIARETSIPPEELALHIKQLEDDGVIESVDSGSRHLYHSRWPAWSAEEWDRLDQGERERRSAEIGWAIKGEIEDAVAAGTFDARPDRYLVRFPLWVDERGWNEINESLEATVASCFAIQQRIRERLEDSDNPSDGFPVRILLVSFEMPPSKD